MGLQLMAFYLNDGLFVPTRSLCSGFPPPGFRWFVDPTGVVDSSRLAPLARQIPGERLPSFGLSTDGE